MDDWLRLADRSRCRHSNADLAGGVWDVSETRTFLRVGLQWSLQTMMVILLHQEIWKEGKEVLEILEILRWDTTSGRSPFVPTKASLVLASL